MNILVTGGAGFIGSHIVDALLEKGHSVRVFDNLDPQVHGETDSPPDYLSSNIEFIKGDVRDKEALRKALKDIDVVYHKAAAVGVGQSMYDIQHYVDVNCMGAAVLLDIIVNDKIKLKKMILASSMSIYGEGKYQCPKKGEVYPQLRTQEQFDSKDWDFTNEDGDVLSALATDESKPLYPTSVYAISKRDQEEMFLSVGAAYDIPVVALRYFNVYGSRQALSNPYTGVAAIFSARVLNGNAPIVYEDGEQQRDFVHISDIVSSKYVSFGI